STATEALPGYSVTLDADGRPMMRLVVGRKDVAEPMLRKWELETARAAAMQRPPRRAATGPLARKLQIAGVLLLIVVSVVGRFLLGRQRLVRPKNPNPFVATAEAWEALSEADRQDIEIQRAISRQPAPDAAPVAPKQPQASGGDSNI